ncbi:MAG TPA: DNA double-strand break repair nuclease NurA, partial [Candidatus Bathyarchaeia archaeon]|nr:DNA double-strand break repair nuclease NurA [Candidatus Bathyarchaeia archaeon]
HAAWQSLSIDPHFLARIIATDAPWPTPLWQGNISAVFPVPHTPIAYHLIAVDGSQIYPDRHEGFSCYVINIGTVILHYLTNEAPTLYSAPSVYSGVDDNFYHSSLDFINGQRQELEFLEGLRIGTKKYTDGHESTIPLLLLFDGSLIFWHLEQKDVHLQDYFLNRYFFILNQLHEHNIFVASYISSPKSKELINLVRMELSDFQPNNTAAYEPIKKMTDTTIALFMLKPYERSTVFKNRSTISSWYPPALAPHFFYLHNGTEIGRVEIPAYIAAQNNSVTTIAQLILDQCTKGYGYPIALAEAHEQAVIKGADRELFYHMLHQMSIDHNFYHAPSQKLAKKRRKCL